MREGPPKGQIFSRYRAIQFLVYLVMFTTFRASHILPLLSRSKDPDYFSPVSFFIRIALIQIALQLCAVFHLERKDFYLLQKRSR